MEQRALREPDEVPAGNPDYAHLNAIQVLPNGDVLMFDNGSSSGIPPALCVDQSNRSGPATDRPQTRVVQWTLDPVAHTATPHVVYAPPGYFTLFAGSAEREPNGDTLIGWAATPRPSPARWTQAATCSGSCGTPRRPGASPTVKATVTDADAPAVSVVSPADGASLDEGDLLAATYSCSDAGGSSLESCGGPVLPGQPLDTSTPGLHSFTVTATDGAGLTTTVTRTYTVRPVAAPQARIRLTGSYRWVQHVSARLPRAGAPSCASGWSTAGPCPTS